MTKDISPHVPNEINEICAKLWSQGIACSAVGGVPRDLILKRFPLKDWDFEVRPVDQDHKGFEKKLQQALGTQANSLGFGVYRTSIGEYQLEFSLPRKESFPQQRPLSHKDLNVTLDSSLDYSAAFKRRDLTINAIALAFTGDNWEWIDPFDGIRDLNNKVARPCGEDFDKDPVRFLRALRFKQLFDLTFSDEIIASFKNFDLSLATDHYLLYESSKAGFFPFMSEFFNLVQQHQIAIPEEWPEYDFLKNNKLEALVDTTDHILLHACWVGDWGLSDMGKLERFLKVRRGRAKHFLTGFEFATEMANIDWDRTTSQWKETDWSELITDELFVRCLEFHKHWDSWSASEEMHVNARYSDLCRGLANWRRHFPRELQGKSEFKQLQDKHEVTPNQRGHFRLWCHLQI